jgi:hypothetical protein
VTLTPVEQISATGACKWFKEYMANLEHRRVTRSLLLKRFAGKAFAAFS